MTKNKRISFIVLFSVFIAVLFGFGTNFVSSNATNTDNTQPTIKSYYSDENGEKIDKTEYTDDESIYSTIELSIPTSKLKYSKITVMDKSIDGIQMVLKKVVDDQGNDITNEFGYENKKYNDENYSGVYTNSPNLDKNDFYNHTYKLIFEEYLSDTDLFVKNADVNGYYNLEHEYQAVFETSDGSNSVISDKITSKIKVTEAVNYSMISADEKANGKTFKPGDTITYTTTISEDVKTQKASDLTFEYEGLGLYDKNSVKVIDSNKKDINFEATQTTQNNLKIVFKDDLTYENPFTLVFKVKVPTNIKENKDFKGYLTTNLNIIGYGKTEEDDELKVTIDTSDIKDNDKNFELKSELKSDKNNYLLDDTAVYTLSVKSENKMDLSKLNNSKINIKFDKKIDTNNYNIHKLVLNQNELTQNKDYIIEKTDDGFVLTLKDIKLQDTLDFNLKYTVSFKDNALAENNFTSTAIISIDENHSYNVSNTVEIKNNTITPDKPSKDDDTPSFVEKANYKITINTDKDTYKNGDNVSSNIMIVNDNEKTPKNFKVKLSYNNVYKIEKITLNNQELNNDEYTILEEDGYFLLSLNNKEFVKNDTLEITYIMTLKDLNVNTLSISAEVLSDNLSSYKFIKMVNINLDNDKSNENIDKNNKSNDEKNEDNKTVSNNDNIISNTNNDTKDKQDSIKGTTTTQTGDNNLLSIAIASTIFIVCLVYVYSFLKKKEN